jgi:hypothetical protein
VTALFGWNQLHRNNNTRDDSLVAGVFTETDFRSNTLNIDGAYVFGGDSNDPELGAVGVGSTQRIGHYNLAGWVNYSWTSDAPSAAADTGLLLFGQLSRTLPYSEDLVYLNGFWGIDQYTSIARDPTVGGPLGQMGLLYASVGLGSYGAALSNRPAEAYGVSAGYQMFFDNDKTQVVLELGGRQSTETHDYQLAAGARLQFALNERTYAQFDGFVSDQDGDTQGYGLRSEMGVQF